MTTEPEFFYVSPAGRMVEDGYRRNGESPYVATVLATLVMEYDASSREQAQEQAADGTWAARSTVLTDADRATLRADEAAGVTPRQATRRLYAARTAAIRASR